MAGGATRTKLGFPVMTMLEIVRATLLVQVMVFDRVGTPMLLIPKSFGPVQFNGKLTGDPKP